MHRRIYISVLLMLLFISAIAQNKEEKKLIIDQVQMNGKKLSGFMKASLADSVANTFSPNCHYVPEFGGVFESRDKVGELIKKEFEKGKRISRYELEAIQYKVYDDIVLEVGKNRVQYTNLPDKKLIVTEYNYMFVWKKSKSGKYQIRAAIWNLPESPCN